MHYFAALCLGGFFRFFGLAAWVAVDQGRMTQLLAVRFDLWRIIGGVHQIAMLSMDDDGMGKRLGDKKSIPAKWRDVIHPKAVAQTLFKQILSHVQDQALD